MTRICIKLITLFISSALLLTNPAPACAEPGYEHADGSASRQTIAPRSKVRKIASSLISLKHLFIPPSSPLGHKQRKLVGRIVDSYNTLYDLKIHDEYTKQLLDNRMHLADRSLSQQWILVASYLGLAGSLIPFVYVFVSDPVSIYSLKVLAMEVLTVILCVRIIKRMENAVASVGTWNHTVVLPLTGYQQDNYDKRFTQSLAHELAHDLKLPNNILLANAYCELMTKKMSREGFKLGEFRNKGDGDYDYQWSQFAKQAMLVISDPIAREASVRKLFSHLLLRRKLNACTNFDEAGKLMREISKDLTQKDYVMPSNRREQGWMYDYATLIGKIAELSCADVDSGLRYVYRLGQAKDSRELADFFGKKGRKPTGLAPRNEGLNKQTRSRHEESL